MNKLIKVKYLLLGFLVALILIVGYRVFAAWQPPGEDPPEGNVATPINTSNVGQVKGGGLELNASGEADVGLIVNGVGDKGKVGIGTDIPKNRIDIRGGAVIGVGYAGLRTAPANGLLVAGNVGIGTFDPQNKLDIEGGVAIGASYSGSQTAPTDGLIVQGSVGIGTVSPQAALHIQPASGTADALKLRPAAGLSGYTLTFKLDNAAASIKHDSSSRDLRLGAANRDDITIKGGDGKVGIGTVSPSATLHVVPSTAIPLRVDDEPIGIVELTPFVVDNDGNVGIGTPSPGARLEVVNDAGEAIVRIRKTAGPGADGRIEFWGAHSPGGPQRELARIRVDAYTAVDDVARLSFFVRNPDGSLEESIKIDSGGPITMGSFIAPSALIDSAEIDSAQMDKIRLRPQTTQPSTCNSNIEGTIYYTTGGDLSVCRKNVAGNFFEWRTISLVGD